MNTAIRQPQAAVSTGLMPLASARRARLLSLVNRLASLSCLAREAVGSPSAANLPADSMFAPELADVLRGRGFGLETPPETRGAPRATPAARGIALYNGEAHFVVDARAKNIDRSRQRELLRDGQGQVGLVLLTDAPLDEGDLEPGVRAVTWACRAG